MNATRNQGVSRRRAPRGFTWIELVVILVILGVLVALLPPAILASRESSRLATCLQHLSRIAVALNGYQAAYGTLPPGTVAKRGPIHNSPHGNHIGWMVRLLPYLGKENVYQQIDLAAGAYAPKNAAARAIRISTFLCPSADNPRLSDRHLSNYAGCHNDVEAPIDADNDGVLFLNSHISDDDIPNGLSHTIFVGEKLGDREDLGWMSGTRATLRNAGTPLDQTINGARNQQDRPDGDLWVGGFASDHPKVCNFLFGGGKADSLNIAIDLKVLQQLANRTARQPDNSAPTRKP